MAHPPLHSEIIIGALPEIASLVADSADSANSSELTRPSHPVQQQKQQKQQPQNPLPRLSGAHPSCEMMNDRHLNLQNFRNFFLLIQMKLQSDQFTTSMVVQRSCSQTLKLNHWRRISVSLSLENFRMAVHRTVSSIDFLQNPVSRAHLQ
ncbi:UNVERIFIED_CONTAM: hypothetical protein Sradi_1780400 [Sesamum radiatum]|uniref:Uncharacterized protein n=1 Tax=Sesamum radiatum TaxID=300843 RepID=A0AAW2TTZ7_SESRA